MANVHANVTQDSDRMLLSKRAGEIGKEGMAEMKRVCSSFQCVDRSEWSEFSSICMEFLLKALAVRIRTRLKYDLLNGYKIAPQFTRFLERYVEDPIGTWFYETPFFCSLPDRMEHAYNTAVLLTIDGSQAANREAKRYRTHANSIFNMIDSIRKCEKLNRRQ